jgi:hypothetical protein
LGLIALAASASAEIQPQRINFQGKLINPTTNNPQTGNVNLTFNLYNVPTGGSSLYTETQNVTLNNGVFSVEIGTINAISRELFLGASVYLGVTVGSDSEMTPRQDLVMSAYAFSANQLSDNTEVRMVAGLTYSTFTSAGNLVVPAGVSASSGIFTNQVTASSATFTYGVTATTMTLTATVGSTITATGTGLTMLETGDTFGSVALSLENRSGANGAVFRQLGSVDLVDFVFQGLNNSRNIRYENRVGSQYMADPEFQIGPAGAPTLVVSDVGASVRVGNLGVGTASPLSLLDVNGVATIRGTLTTVSSATFQATGGGTFSLGTSSGISMNSGTLSLVHTSGIHADDTGIVLSTIDFVGSATDPGSANPGYMYYNTSTGSIKVYDGSNAWAYVFGQPLNRKTLYTTSNTAAINVAKTANAAIMLVPFFISGPMMVDSLQCVVTTALGATGDIGVYNAAGTLVLNGGSGSLSVAVGLKTVTPTQTGTARFLPPGQYYAAITYNSTTGRVGGDTLSAAGAISGVGTIAAGGGTVLPATITLSGLTTSTVMFYFEMHP